MSGSYSRGHFQSEMPLHRPDSQHLIRYGYLKLRIVWSELFIQGGAVSVLNSVTTGWMVWGSNPCVSAIFHAYPEWLHSPLSFSSQ
jgi:hypothetical protein